MTDLAVTINGVRYVRDDMPKRILAERDALRAELGIADDNLRKARAERDASHEAHDATIINLNEAKAQHAEARANAQADRDHANKLQDQLQGLDGQRAVIEQITADTERLQAELAEARAFSAQQRSDMEATISEQSQQLAEARAKYKASDVEMHRLLLRSDALCTQLRTAAERARDRCQYGINEWNNGMSTRGYTALGAARSLLDAALSAVETATPRPELVRMDSTQQMFGNVRLCQTCHSTERTGVLGIPLLRVGMRNERTIAEWQWSGQLGVTQYAHEGALEDMAKRPGVFDADAVRELLSSVLDVSRPLNLHTTFKLAQRVRDSEKPAPDQDAVREGKLDGR